MKLLFSEAAPDYQHYIFPYAIWGFPEPGETAADFLEAGFLPSSRELNRFYLARQIRIRLRDFAASSENRRVLRKCPDTTWRLVPSGEFQLTEARRAFCKAYADARFGSEVMSLERLDTLFAAPVATHIMIFEEKKPDGYNREVGYVVLYVEEPRAAFYYYSFYDLDYFDRSLGLFIMTTAVQAFAERTFAHLYLGTCYSERALYKTQFSGCEFFNGFRWSADVKELKYLVSRQAEHPGKHLLETPDYLPVYYQASAAELAKASAFIARKSP